MRVHLLIVLALLLFATNAGAFSFGRPYNYYINGIDSVVGTIQGFGRNTLYFYDEYSKMTRSFVYLYRFGDFKPGERVRLYYYVDNRVVQDIKIITPVEYRREGANQGYLLHANTHQ